MYKLKTGALFQFCFSTPFMLTNHKKEIIEFYRKFGLLFGLVFQIIDDLIDTNNDNIVSQKEIDAARKILKKANKTN